MNYDPIGLWIQFIANRELNNSGAVTTATVSTLPGTSVTQLSGFGNASEAQTTVTAANSGGIPVSTNLAGPPYMNTTSVALTSGISVHSISPPTAASGVFSDSTFSTHATPTSHGTASYNFTSKAGPAGFSGGSQDCQAGRLIDSKKETIHGKTDYL